MLCWPLAGTSPASCLPRGLVSKLLIRSYWAEHATGAPKLVTKPHVSGRMEEPSLCPRWDAHGAPGTACSRVPGTEPAGTWMSGYHKPRGHPMGFRQDFLMGAHQDRHSAFLRRPLQLGRRTGSVGRSKHMVSHRAIMDWRVGSTPMGRWHRAGRLLACRYEPRRIPHWTKQVLILFLRCGSKCALQYPVWLLQRERHRTQKRKKPS